MVKRRSFLRSAAAGGVLAATPGLVSAALNSEAPARKTRYDKLDEICGNISKAESDAHLPDIHPDVPYLKGWRAEIGILSTNAGHEREWDAVAPEGVRFVRGLMGINGATPEKLRELADRAEGEAVKINLPYTRDLICFHCTSGSFVGGLGYDQQIIERIEKISGSPATTTTTCVLEALNDMGVKKMMLVGPYTDDVFDLEVKYFEANNIEAIYVKGSGQGFQSAADFWDYAMDPYAGYKLIKAVKIDPSVDCVFLTCTASPMLGVADVLEKETGKPLISSNSATLYGMLKKVGIPDPIYNYGELLTRPRPSGS